MTRFAKCHAAYGCGTLEEAVGYCVEPVIEPKLDGWRITAEVTEERAIIRSGYNRRIQVLPEMEEQLRATFQPGTIVDGEIIHAGTRGTARVGWGSVQSVLSTQRRVPERDQLVFVIFDVVQIPNPEPGELPLDISSLSLKSRRRWLKARNWDRSGIRPNLDVIPQFEATDEMVELIMGQGMEGVIVKDLTKPYQQGKRGYGWYKLKPRQDEDVTIVGFTDGNGEFAGKIGAVKFEAEDGTLGQCSGMTLAVRQDMTDHPSHYIGRKMEIVHEGRMPTGGFRSAQFSRMRPDKDIS